MFWPFLLSQAEILGYLEKACQLIPDQGLTAECKEMVDSYYPIIIGIITGELVSNVDLTSYKIIKSLFRNHIFSFLNCWLNK